VPDFKEYRMRLVTAGTVEEIMDILGEVDKKYAFEMA
jgi:hypothetical protein